VNGNTEKTPTLRVRIYPDARARAGESLELARLKNFASRELRNKSVLRSLLLYEKDRLAPDEFLAKMEIWLRLLDFELVDK